ncbi:MAG: hypothetical protein GF353_25490 [Candidatus Lokiarchaeota archaeon]|nr:hypothetical protein [Candidatus Lokiarchaeota archaeon]
MKISAEKGNKYADSALIKDKEELIKKIIEYISVNLQAEFHRISSSSLTKLNTHEIGKSIKDIIEDYLLKAILIIEEDKQSGELLRCKLTDMLENINSIIQKDVITSEALHRVSQSNLIHDFGQIVDQISNLDVQGVDRILRYLVLLNISRRLDRRCVLPK